MARAAPKLRIPEQQRAAIRAFGELSPEQVHGLKQALAGAKAANSAPALARQIAPKVEIDRDTLVEIVAMLVSLSATSQRYEIPLDQLVTAVTDRAVEQQLGPTQETAEAFKKKLHQLLLLDQPLDVTSRVLNVMWETKNVFISARVVSDVRSIFSAGDPPEPIAAAVVHNLRIESHTDDRHVNSYFAMDTADLRDLRDMIDRALRKEEALRRVLRDTQLEFVDMGYDRGDPDD